MGARVSTRILMGWISVVGLASAVTLAADVVPPTEVDRLLLDRVGGEVSLSWAPVNSDLFGASETISNYRVYSASTADFVPDKLGQSNLVASPVGTQWTDNGAAGSSQPIFYLVSAVDAEGQEGNTRPAKVGQSSITLTTFGPDSATPRWNQAQPISDVGGYLIVWGTTSLTYDAGMDVGQVTSSLIAPILENTDYFLSVVPYDNERNFAVDPDAEFSIVSPLQRSAPQVTGAGQEPVRDDPDADAAAIYAPMSRAPGSSTVLHSGEKRFDRVDLEIPGRGEVHFKMGRRYRSQIEYDGPLGYGWDFTYNESLYVQPNGDVLRSNGAGLVDLWERNPDDSFSAPAGHFRTLIQKPDGSFVLRSTNGFKRHFDAQGRLESYSDRNGNTMRFEYDARSNLDSVIDPYERVIDFEFALFADGRERLARVVDFAGRELVYSYDADGNLASARSPIVVGTSTGNDFPDGRTEAYTYSSGFSDDRLNHNLLTVTLGEEVATSGPPAMDCEYGTEAGDPLTFDRVINETLGGTNASGVPAGGSVTYAYEELSPGVPLGNPDVPRLKTTVTDRNGNVSESFSNELLHEIELRQLTRGLRPGEPASFDTISTYDADGQQLCMTYPAGNELCHAYGAGSRAAMRNLIEVRQVADPARGGGDDLVTTYTYEPLNNQLASVTDPRGNAASFAPPLGSASAERYTTRYTFDYQESNTVVPDAVEFGIDLTGIPRGLGDRNSDGRIDQIAGNAVRVDSPTVLLRAGSNEALRLGSTLQTVLDEYQFNDRGQPVRIIDREGNVTVLDYYTESDPDGDGVQVLGAGGSSNTGYLRSRTVDGAPASARRTATVAPVQLETIMVYDAVGNPTSTTNPRGVETTIEYNALNEVVEVTRGAEVVEAIARGQLITGEPAYQYRTRVYYDSSGRPVLFETENRDSNTPGVGEFVDHHVIYDILGNPVVKTVEVDADTTLTTQFRYDANELHSETIHPEGNRYVREYDERNLAFRHTRGAGSSDASTTQVNYDINGNGSVLRDAEDNDGDLDPDETLIFYDGFDRLVRRQDALGNETLLSYDPASNLSRTQVNGHPAGQPNAANVLLSDTRYSHDELDRVFQTDQALFLAAGFNPLRAVQLQDGNSDGFVTDFTEFDALSRQTFDVEDDGETTTRIYDGASRVIEQIDALNNRTITTYDRNSNPVIVTRWETSPEGLVSDESFTTRYVWDQLDRLVRATDNVGNTHRFGYDSRDNRIFSSDPQGPLTNDPLGLFPGMINETGNTRSYFFDGQDRLTRQVTDLRADGQGGNALDLSNAENPDGQITIQQIWDDNSRLEGIVDDKLNRTSLFYDDLDRKVRILLADGEDYVFTYDRDDNQTQVIDPNGSVISRTFDVLNRPTQVDVTRGVGVAGTTQETQEYDGLSRITRSTDDNFDSPTINVTVYDSLSRVLEEQQNGRAISKVWSGDGRRVATIYPGGREVTYTHDAIDRVKTISKLNLIAEMYWIGPGLRELKRQLGNGTMITMLNDDENQNIGWDDRPLLVDHRYLGPGGSVLAHR